MARTKHVPIRTCIACRVQRPKRDLIRIVRSPDGTIAIDSHGKAAGRGAYLCRRRECLESAVQAQRLSRALKTRLSKDVIDRLHAQLSEFEPEE